MSSLTPHIDEITRRLSAVRTSTVAVGVLSAIALGLVATGLAWLVISTLDMGLGLTGLVLRIIAVALLLAAVAILARGLVRVLRVSHSIKAYAARVGAELKEIGLDLLTALELSDVDDRRLGYSRVLIGRTIDDIAGKLKDLDLQASVKKRVLLLYSLPLVALLILGLGWSRYDPASLEFSLARLRYFWGLTDRSGISVVVMPGDGDILAGSAVEIGARVAGFGPKQPILHVVSDGEETAFRMERVDSTGTRGLRSYTAVLAQVDRDIGYFVTLGDEKTRVYRLTVYEEPRIRSGTIRLAYPPHTGLREETLPSGMWDVSAPYGTRMTMALAANCKVDSAWIAVGDSGSAAGRIPVTVSGDSLMAATTLYGDFSYTVHMVAAGGTNAKPHGPHEVKVSRDESPYVRIESPDREILLEADLIIPLSVVALDDYGISRMTLTYECPTGTASMDLDYRGRAQARSELAWDVAQLDVFPGDAITYWVTVADNDALTGPKYARTDAYVARVPTVYDLYHEIESHEEEDLDYLAGATDEAEKLKDEFKDLIQDMKREREMDWEEEQAIKQSLASQDEVNKKIEDAASSMDETLEMMSENKLVNFEVIEKMEEIRRLLSEVATAEMREAMDRLREAMEKLSPEEIKSAMENLNLTQEDLLRRLDMAIEMLKRLQAQQRMEAVLNLAKQISEGQKQVNDSVREGEDLTEAQRNEQGLIKDTDRLAEMMQALSDMLKTQGNPLAGQIDEAGEFLKASKAGESMSMALSAMGGGSKAQALEHGESAEDSMSKLASMLQAASDALTGEERRQVMEALTRTMHALRDISGKQESAISEMRESPEMPSDSELARREMVLKEALNVIANDLFDVARKSLFVSPMLGRAVLKIGDEIGSASDLLAGGKRAQAGKSMKTSLGQVNQMVTGLMDVMEKASSCSSPSGLCDAFQGLENMCCMQMGINQGTQNLLGQLGDGEQGLSMEARAQMARLAAEQEQVAKGIGDLAKEFGGRAEILGRLDDLAEGAKRIIDDLRRERVNEETLRSQERILTRLLNAQRSLRRRDYTERRQSRPGEDFQAIEPPPLSLGETERLMQDLLYRKRGYYPPEYEELIRAYFKAISSKRPSQ